MANIVINIKDNQLTKNLDFEVALSEQFNKHSPAHRLGKFIVENIDRITKEMADGHTEQQADHADN